MAPWKISCKLNGSPSLNKVFLIELTLKSFVVVIVCSPIFNKNDNVSTTAITKHTFLKPV